MESTDQQEGGVTNAPTTPGNEMLAVLQDTYGPAGVLRMATIARPEVGVDDVLVRVQAATVHMGDWHLMTGQPYLMRILGFGLRRPKQRVRGSDVAGTVEAVGGNVTAFKGGDEVFGTCDGAYAEFATAREKTLAPKPGQVSFAEAASVPTSGCTALQALRAGGVAPGQRVLVIGASGGVGMFAVQLAKSYGAEVTGVCSAAKVDLVRSLGADHVLAYDREDFSSDGQRYDLIVVLAGNRSLTQLRRSLKHKGSLVLVGGEDGGHWIGAAMVRSLRALVLSPFVSQQLRMVAATVTQDDLEVLRELLATARIRPVIDRTYPLSRAPEAIGYLHAGHARGKLVIAA